MKVEVSNCCRVPVNHVVRGVLTTLLCPKCGKPCRTVTETAPYVHTKKERKPK